MQSTSSLKQAIPRYIETITEASANSDTKRVRDVHRKTHSQCNSNEAIVSEMKIDRDTLRVKRDRATLRQSYTQTELHSDRATLRKS